MKKYFNKGLIYQWFNSSKMIILLGIIAWGLVSYIIVQDNINGVSWKISEYFENSYETQFLCNYLILGIIFSLIHFMSQGINKRNNNMFLTSAPYTKKQIKYNEFICLMINLVVFIGVFVYISIMAYIKHYELISIIDGYFKVLGIEILKMILFGIIGILILLIIDSMFSNTIVGIICMISIIPGAFLCIIFRVSEILHYSPWEYNRSIGSKIGEFIYNNLFKSNTLCLFESISINKIHGINMLYESLFLAIIILALLGIYYIMQKKYKVESNTKIFTSKLYEKIVVGFSSIGAGCFASTVLFEFYIKDFMGIYYGPLNDGDLVKILGIDFACITIVTFIVYKLINKVLKNIQ